jgi:hypothetical protein
MEFCGSAFISFDESRRWKNQPRQLRTMPLNCPEDYERLGKHLAVIDAPLAAFAAGHGYTIYAQPPGGHYPNRHITQEGFILRSIQISMETDRHGECFDHFFPEIPYNIFGAAWIDDHSHRIRLLCPNIRIEAIPFSTLVQTLSLHLNHFHGYLSGITEDYIRACAITTPLAS